MTAAPAASAPSSIRLAIRLDGVVDFQRLAAAVERVFERHQLEAAASEDWASLQGARQVSPSALAEALTQTLAPGEDPAATRTLLLSAWPDRYHLVLAARSSGLSAERLFDDLVAAYGGEPEVPDLPVPRDAAARFLGGATTLDRDRRAGALTRSLPASVMAKASDDTVDDLVLTAAVVLLQRYAREHEVDVALGWAAPAAIMRLALEHHLTGRAAIAEVKQAKARALLPSIVRRDADPVLGVIVDPGFRAAARDGLTLSYAGTIEPLLADPAGLALVLRVEEGRPIGYTLWAPRAWSTGVAATLADQLDRLLEGLVHTPDEVVGRLPLLSPAERAATLAAVDVSPNEAAMVAPGRFEQQAARTPDAVAVVMNGVEVSYRELDAWSNRLAHRLVRLGTLPGSLVGIYCGRSLEMLVAVIAVAKAGAAYLPLDPAHPSARLAAIVEDAQPPVVLAQGSLVAACKLLVKTEVVAVDGPEDAQEPGSSLGLTVDPTSLAYVMFTSGSTGRPKGVEIQHGALANFLASMAKAPGMTPADRILSVTTLSFDIAQLELWLPLWVGGSVEIADEATRKDAGRLALLLGNPAITVFQATPTTYRMLLETGWAGKQGLKVLCGGEAFPPDLIRGLRERVGEVWNMYGPTETTVWSSVKRLEDAELPVSVGRPVANTSLYVLNAVHEPMPFGAIGEIYIGGQGLARGYRNRPELTAERFVSDPFSAEPGARMYRTGDLGRFLPDGTLACLGRADFQVKIRGHRIEPGEIEAALLSSDEVVQAVVVGREDDRGDKSLVAYVVPGSGAAEGRAQRLRDLLRERLPPHMVPATFVVLPRLPLTASGKIDRNSLPAPELEPQARADAQVLPADDLEALLLAIFGEFLGDAPIGIEQSFFDVGGDSLTAVRMVRRLEQALQRKLPLSALFSAPTVRSLAEYLRVQGTSSTRPQAMRLRRGTGPQKFFFLSGIALYQHLARALPRELASYGIFSPAEAQIFGPENLRVGSLHGPPVSAIAADYVQAIRALQPDGPYLLGGISFGGVVAYEVAQKLQAGGGQVQLLVLLDALLPEATRSGPIRRTVRGLVKAVRDPLTRSMWRKIAEARLGTNQNIAWQEGELSRLRDVVQDRLAREYRPTMRPYKGDVVLYAASDRSAFKGGAVDAAAGWRELVSGRFEVRHVAGDHLGMVKPPHAEALARRLAEAVERTTAAQGRSVRSSVSGERPSP